MVDIAAVAKKVAPNIKDNYFQALSEGGALFQQSGITTPIRIAHFLAQVLHETGGGIYLRENLNYTTECQLLKIFGVDNSSADITAAEAPALLGKPEALAERVYGQKNESKAKELGNINPGDAYKFRGAGLLQTTGGANFKEISDATGIDFYNHPELAIDPRYALKPALYKWDGHNLNDYADKNDIRTITKAINGGINNLPDRKNWFNKIWAVIGDGSLPASTQSGEGGGDDGGDDGGDENTIWLQKSLNTLGYTPALTVDGVTGPATTKAVKWFQADAGLTVDGKAGPKTYAAVKDRLARAGK